MTIKRTFYLILLVLVLGSVWFRPAMLRSQESTMSDSGYVGSSDCRRCHERFYRLWAPSHHGLAMRLCTPEFSRDNLKPQTEPILVKGMKYRFVVQSDENLVLEQGPSQEKKYPVRYAIGGKNVYYFLTELDKGKLQVLPIAYDVNTDTWFDTAASAVRHFVDQPDSPYHWTDYPYTFNTSCYGCHVSQLTNTYDLKTDTYHTVWKEPGINCETCHGPGQKHIEIAESSPDANDVNDWGLVVVTPAHGFTAHQTNAACSNCHAKMSPLSDDFKPGDDFCQFYDLITYEHPDYYPDGRDLGENYTYTSWRQSPCAQAGDLNCLTCHTSSGRYRFHGPQANNACMTCHEDKVKDFVGHSHHEPDTNVTQCIQCHMPMTKFGNMNRSDHSMRPPMPSATMQFGSPNACNLCHTAKTPEWADKKVRTWHKDDYQQETLKLGTWVKKLRQQDWSDLQEILAYVESPERDEMFTNSMIRLLQACPGRRQVSALVHLLRSDTSPLCRSSAATALSRFIADEQVMNALIDATADSYRLVRIRAAAALAPVPIEHLSASKRTQVQKAVDEYKAAMLSRPDDGVAYFNLANFYMDRGNMKTAIDYFKTSIRLRPDFTPALLNVSLVYNQMGQNEKALASLDKALKMEPKAASVHLNRALLLGEMGRYSESEQAFRSVLKYNPHSAVAAYNLGILLSRSNPKESLKWIRKAHELEPEQDKYAYTAAYYAYQYGYTQEAVNTLQKMVDEKTDYADVYGLLASIFMKENRFSEAIQVYETAAGNNKLPEAIRIQFAQRADSLKR